MILSNGVVRTMDPSLPTTAALAIAGERIAGGVGTHENALPTPDHVDLRGRCVLPAFTDSHVHFPTWSLSKRDVHLDGVATLAEALARVAAHTPVGAWIRGHGWRDASWEARPTRHALDEVTGETPAALWSKDYHSLWLNSAALARAGGDLELPGGVVERDDAGELTGVLREESAWQFRSRHVTVSEDEWVAATRDGLKLASARGVGAIHDKDGWLGAPAIFGRIHEQGGLTVRVWQSLPLDQVDQLAKLRLRSRIGDDYLRLGYLKAFMDGTLGSQTAWMLDGSGVRITSGEELAELIRAAAAAGWPVAVHAIGDRANREALDAFEATREAWQPLGLRQRIEHAQCLDPTDLPRFAELGVACSVQFSHAPSDRDLAERYWGDRLDGTYAFRSLVDSGAVVVERLRCTGRGARPATGHPRGCPPDARRPGRVAARAGRHGRAGAPCLHGGTGVARRRRASPRQAAPGVPRRPRRARPRPRDVRGRRARRHQGHRNDGRRPLGAQPAALGLSARGRGRRGTPAAACPSSYDERSL